MVFPAMMSAAGVSCIGITRAVPHLGIAETAVVV